MSQPNDAKFVTRKISLMRVIEELYLRVPSPAVGSTVAAGVRKTRVEGNAGYEQYPKTYAAKGLLESADK